LIERLPAAERSEYRRKLAEVVAPHQEPDGSWWDYAMWDYHKPYGTAFAVMTLLGALRRIERTRSVSVRAIVDSTRIVAIFLRSRRSGSERCPCVCNAGTDYDLDGNGL
jgi:hypothetical protein